MALRVAIRRVGVIGGGAAAGFTAYRYNQIKSRESLLPTNSLDVFQHDAQGEKVLVIGGGVVGVTTAYKLALKGHSVAVLEPRPSAGEECSACAAGGMQQSNSVVDYDSWVNVTKCIAPKLGSLLFGGDASGFKFFNIDWYKTLSDPFFLRWVLTFTQTSLFPDKDQQQKQVDMLRFAKFAVQDMVDMMEDAKDNMARTTGYNPRGSLSLSYEPVVPARESVKAIATSARNTNPSQSKRSFEPSRRLVGEEIFQQEPSLLLQSNKPTAAKYEYEARAASSGRFTKELAKRCDKLNNVNMIYDTKVQAIGVAHSNRSGKSRISELKTNKGVIQVPEGVKVVVAAGAWTPHVLSLMNLYAPVYPLKGYAMSVSASEAIKEKKIKPQDLPSRVVCDKYMYTSRLGDEIRITSIGEFSGWSTKPTPHVDEEFRREAKRQFPQLEDLIGKAETHCGHRPYVNDGILLLGAMDTHENLFVSCGPGSNGWKFAMGSGEIVERLVSGQTEEEISKELGFNASTFSPAGRVLNSPVFSKLCRTRWGV